MLETATFPLPEQAISPSMLQVLREAGVAKKFSAHSTRATAAVLVAFDKGVPISVIMKTPDGSSFRLMYSRNLVSFTVN